MYSLMQNISPSRPASADFIEFGDTAFSAKIARRMAKSRSLMTSPVLPDGRSLRNRAINPQPGPLSDRCNQCDAVVSVEQVGPGRFPFQRR